MRKGEIQRLHKPDRSILLYIPYGIIVLLSNARKNGTFVSYFYRWWCDEMADKDDDDDTTHAKQCLRQCVCVCAYLLRTSGLYFYREQTEWKIEKLAVAAATRCYFHLFSRVSWIQTTEHTILTQEWWSPVIALPFSLLFARLFDLPKVFVQFSPFASLAALYLRYDRLPSLVRYDFFLYSFLLKFLIFFQLDSKISLSLFFSWTNFRFFHHFLYYFRLLLHEWSFQNSYDSMKLFDKYFF